MVKNAAKNLPKIDEHSVPLFWPLAAAFAMEKAELGLFQKNLKFLAEAEKVDHELKPQFATGNTVMLDLHTLRLREFGDAKSGAVPTLVDAPYAGHTATIADYHKGQSLVETLLANGHRRVLVTDWKNAGPEMKDYDIDNYLAEINVCVDDLGARVNLVGLCQGGWMSAMYAARYPDKVATLVLAGSPIDTKAGDGPLKKMVDAMPASFYEELVQSGDGLMRGRLMLEGWKSMHPEAQYVDKYLRLYEHIDDPDYLSKTETFARWYENPIDLPGRWYLQAIHQLFQENRLAQGTFVGLGRRLSLADIRCPVYLLAGDADDITPKEQVFAAERLVGTPKSRIAKALAPGGHIGLFMGAKTLSEQWPLIARWIVREQNA
ncbi:MAG: alpha/beta fold hydrolase [Burkholderiales bacterium]|nr:alpha/beta fold hydrolase [Burkholderiales bacterium]